MITESPCCHAPLMEMGFKKKYYVCSVCRKLVVRTNEEVEAIMEDLFGSLRPKK